MPRTIIGDFWTINIGRIILYVCNIFYIEGSVLQRRFNFKRDNIFKLCTYHMSCELKRHGSLKDMRV